MSGRVVPLLHIDSSKLTEWLKAIFKLTKRNEQGERLATLKKGKKTMIH